MIPIFYTRYDILRTVAEAIIVNSDTTQNDCHYWTFPASCLRTAIVLELPLSVEDLASLTHCGSYCNYTPTEADQGLPSPL